MPASFPPPRFHVVGSTRPGLPAGKSFYSLYYVSIVDPSYQIPMTSRCAALPVTAPELQTRPPQDAACQAGQRHVTRQGSVDAGGQGQGQSCHNDGRRRRRGYPASVQVSFGDPCRGPRVPEPNMGCPSPQIGDFIIWGMYLLVSLCIF
jgi:hypothetical protein